MRVPAADRRTIGPACVLCSPLAVLEFPKVPYVNARGGVLADIAQRGLVEGLAPRASRRLKPAGLPGARAVEG